MRESIVYTSVLLHGKSFGECHAHVSQEFYLDREIDENGRRLKMKLVKYSGADSDVFQSPLTSVHTMRRCTKNVSIYFYVLLRDESVHLCEVRVFDVRPTHHSQTPFLMPIFDGEPSRTSTSVDFLVFGARFHAIEPMEKHTLIRTPRNQKNDSTSIYF